MTGNVDSGDATLARLADRTPTEIHMRWTLSQTLSLCLVAALTPAVASPATAADLGVTPRKVVRHHHAVLRVVRDYDGMPIVIRRRSDGTADTHFAERATPTRYLNGQPVTAYR
jgi:hypothetical protein